MVGDRDQSRRAPFLSEAAGGVGEQQRLAAQRAERVDRDPHRARIAPLVIVAAPLKQRDPLSLDHARHEAPGMALDARNRKARNVDVRDGDCVLRLVGKGAKAGTQHDGERRQQIEAAGLERRDGGSDILKSHVFPPPVKAAGR